MLQVSGRAGRRQKRGKVIIQSISTKYKILPHILNSDYEGFYGMEIYERMRFAYPPFSRMIQLTLKHKDSKKVNDAAFILAKGLEAELTSPVLGPAVPMVSRVRSFYLRQIIIKISRQGQSIFHTKEVLRKNMNKLKSDKRFASVVVVVDVDPY